MTTTYQALPGTPRNSLSLSVLLVDDHRDAAEPLALLLAEYGCHVRTAYGAEAALDAEPADVVILELLLSGLNGWEVVRWIRARPTIKQSLFIALTTCGSKDDQRRSAEAGIDLHLIKPVEPAVLHGVLRRFARVLAPQDDGRES